MRGIIGAMLCWLGIHDWGRWRTAPWTLPGLRWRYCERMPRTCKAKQFDIVRDGGASPIGGGKETVHLINLATHRDIRFACDRVWSVPAWKQPELPEGIHQAEDGRLYCFDVDKATCPVCRKGLAA